MAKPTLIVAPVVHARAAQVSGAAVVPVGGTGPGYALNQLVVHGGVTWQSLVAHNLSVPGEHPTWDFFR